MTRAWVLVNSRGPGMRPSHAELYCADIVAEITWHENERAVIYFHTTSEARATILRKLAWGHALAAHAVETALELERDDVSSASVASVANASVASVAGARGWIRVVIEGPGALTAIAFWFGDDVGNEIVEKLS